PHGRRDLAQLDAIISQSLDRLRDFQHGDGGWGWWKESDSDHWMTAYVLWGLTLARDAGIGSTNLPTGMLEKAARYLDLKLVEEEENVDMQAWMLHALTVFQAASKQPATDFQKKAFDHLWENREKLNAYTRALLALTAHHSG